jgi:SAM-dependent methyltransferase
MAAFAFTLGWRSDLARHSDCLVAPKINLWRDVLPPGMEAALLDQTAGHALSRVYAAGELIDPYRDRDCVQAPSRAFNRHFRKCYIEPRRGRFYPKGLIAGVKGVYPEDLTPFRLADVAEEDLILDLNHPLAGRELSLEARILDIWQGHAEHGGVCQGVAEMVTLNGPGMQARWRGEPTDFWSDIPFDRMDPSPDADFYRQPRLVQHLDTTALRQVESLYARLLPKGARILDLMTSWTSHLPTVLAPSQVVGLGMNAEELAANPLLNGRHIHDLNQEPHLPFTDNEFDAVVCTVSVEYLTRPREVFREVRRVLRPGGRFVVSFSNRWFPPKVIKVWQETHEFERLGLVIEYFHEAGGYGNLETWSLRGLPRPADDKYARQMPLSDPIFAVWADRVS